MPHMLKLAETEIVSAVKWRIQKSIEGTNGSVGVEFQFRVMIFSSFSTKAHSRRYLSDMISSSHVSWLHITVNLYRCFFFPNFKSIFMYTTLRRFHVKSAPIYFMSGCDEWVHFQFPWMTIFSLIFAGSVTWNFTTVIQKSKKLISGTVRKHTLPAQQKVERKESIYIY